MLSFAQSTNLLVQDTGPAPAPTIVYVPGLQGDWTLNWQIRPLLNRSNYLVELGYPHASARWTLNDYVARLLEVFDRLELSSAHLLAESFGSLPAQLFCLRYPERVNTLILAGGVSSSPGMLKDLLVQIPMRLTPEWFKTWFLTTHSDRNLARLGFPPNAFRCAGERFPAWRSWGGREAVLNRMRLVRHADLRPQLGELRLPVFYIGGAADRIVPVRQEIATYQRLLPMKDAFRGVILPGAPHPVIPARHQQVADLIEEWVCAHENAPQPA